MKANQKAAAGRAANGSKAPAARRRRRTPEAQEEMRERITRTALAIFKKQGIDAVTMRSVAREMGVSSMGVYTYFDNRAALLQSLWGYVFEKLDVPLRASLEGPRTPDAKLVSYSDAFLRYWETHPDQYRLVYGVNPEEVHAEPGAMMTNTSYSTGLLRVFELITEIAGPKATVESCRLALDRLLTQVIGYLHCRLIVKRYTFTNVEGLRNAVLAGLVPMIKEMTASKPD